MKTTLIALGICIFFSLFSQEPKNQTSVNVCSLGDYYYSKHQYQLAIKQYDSCFAVEPENLDFLKKKASCNYKLGRLSMAKAIYKQLLILNDRDVEVMHSLSQLSIKQDDYLGALQYNKMLLAMDSLNPYYYKSEG